MLPAPCRTSWSWSREAAIGRYWTSEGDRLLGLVEGDTAKGVVMGEAVTLRAERMMKQNAIGREDSNRAMASVSNLARIEMVDCRACSRCYSTTVRMRDRDIARRSKQQREFHNGV